MALIQPGCLVSKPQCSSCLWFPGTSITDAGCHIFFFSQCGRIKCRFSYWASTLPAKRSCQPTSGVLISLSHPHNGTVSAFSLTFKVINEFNHFSLQPSQRLVQFSGGSHGPAQLPAVLLDSHTTLRGIFPTVSCTVLLPRLLPQLSHTQHCGLTFHFVMAVTHHMCDARLRVACIITIFTPLMSPPVTSLFTHSVLPYHILGAHTGPHSSVSRLLSHKLGTTTYYHTVSFPHVYVFDSHDVTPFMYPSLSPESTHKVPTVSHT